jgi:flagellar basal-body rod modification protein FlgD
MAGSTFGFDGGAPMSVTATTTPSGLAQAANATAQAGADRTAIASDYDTFLRMLTAQLNNQDPLDPMDTKEFAVQLATFSLVEQQVRTNALLESLTGDGLSAAAGLIGMEARAPVAVFFAGSPITVYPQFAVGATAAQLVVRDAGGAIVDRRAITPGETPVTWDGVGANGATLPEGAYRFEVESREGDAILDTLAADTWGRIVEVTLQAGVPHAVFEAGDSLAADDLSALRDAPGAG